MRSRCLSNIGQIRHKTCATLVACRCGEVVKDISLIDSKRVWGKMTSLVSNSSDAGIFGQVKFQPDLSGEVYSFCTV